MHNTKHPLAGKNVPVEFAGKGHPQFGKHINAWIEDWWDHMDGTQWHTQTNNPACVLYALRCQTSPLEIDDEVVYAKIGSRSGLGVLVHVSELRDPEAVLAGGSE